MISAQQSGLIDWEWIGRNAGALRDRGWEHIYLTVVSVAAGFVIAAALTALVMRHRRTYGPITALTGILYSIPSLALFAALVPIIGIGELNAIVALTSYTLLILIRNMVAGIDGVAAAVKEAADGMGYTRRQRFWSTELPLAAPVIIAGLRIASVTTVGLVTVSSLLGLGGFGFYILRGINTFNWTQITVGIVGSVILATVIDVAFIMLSRLITPWARRKAA